MRRSLAIPVVVAALAVAVVVPAGAAQDLDDELSDIESRIDQLATQIGSADESRSELADQVLAAESRMEGLVGELEAARDELASARADRRSHALELSEARNSLQDLHLELERTREELAAGEEAARRWTRQMYMDAGQDTVTFVAGAGHVSDIAVGIEYLSRVAVETDRVILELESLQVQEESQVEQVRRRERELEEDVVRLGELEDELADVEAELDARHAAVTDEVAHQRDLLGEVEGEIAHFEGELAALEEEQERIEDEIRTQQTALADSGGGGGTATGTFARPVPGPVSSGFGPRVHPILGYSRMHTGLDMSAGQGEPIRAADGGTVILAGGYGGYGNTVVVDHGGGLTTLYAHQSQLAVGHGQSVGRGDVVGYVGSTGLSTGPHLHFEVRVGGGPVDPAPYL